ncbi:MULTISPECIES: helix-turn-helix transcriptional regulator [Bacillus]|uniref:XRE family transcriptional regulator n=1 Tax=Bacillus glycinifermentans TaxID=1664069 RepID=A0AAJ3Z1D0_9BACI|nr:MULTISPECIES: helix-turn-helix transcriptional regulator [Bacillus]KKB75322.1 transcriptional regulator [Bacillus sp. TH008]MDU0070700.1 helix-turn-helix transcriptional regulator [Bacillus sp. IG6]MED8018564.1 helix-turn-helix transcriptional regulator [Bacillus glycinifermentans]QAT67011.1 XRE family transcriptional regulator [Bacillus glycinifermentans]WKB76726.1 helix-turn-helix transcriptional regulator [Bacillus glycinifermentans]
MYSTLFITRKEKRKSQKDIAKVLNIHTQSYHLKEAGKREFTLSEAKKLAHYFNTSLDNLFGDNRRSVE